MYDYNNLGKIQNDPFIKLGLGLRLLPPDDLGDRGNQTKVWLQGGSRGIATNGSHLTWQHLLKLNNFLIPSQYFLYKRKCKRIK